MRYSVLIPAVMLLAILSPQTLRAQENPDLRDQVEEVRKLAMDMADQGRAELAKQLQDLATQLKAQADNLEKQARSLAARAKDLDSAKLRQQFQDQLIQRREA